MKPDLEQSSMTTTDIADQLAGLQRLVTALTNRVMDIAEQSDARWHETVTTSALAHVSDRLVQVEHQVIGHDDAILRLTRRLNTPTPDLDGQLREARAEVARLARERDEAESHNRKSVVVEMQTVEAIAAWLERRAAAILASASTGDAFRLAQHRAAGLTDAVDALRAGTWRTEGSDER